MNTSTDTKCLREGQRAEAPERVRLLKTLKVERKVTLVQATVQKALHQVHNAQVSTGFYTGALNVRNMLTCQTAVRSPPSGV